MSASESSRPASLRAAGAARSVRRGDVPEQLLAVYLTDQAKGRTLGFYVDARATRPAFRDGGDRLFADRNDPNAIRSMIQIAAHRGWSTIMVRGDESFRREAWREGRERGLEIRGYDPTPRDIEAASRQADRSRGPRSLRKSLAKPMSLERRAAIVEAVVAARMLDPERARRLLDAVKAKLAPTRSAAKPVQSRER